MDYGIEKLIMRKALTLYMANSYWERYYREAPTEKCRQYIECQYVDGMIAFLSMDAPEQREKAWRAMLQVEKELTLQDWQHLLKYCGNNPRYVYIRGMIQSLENGEKP